jgi:hypothetical protein
VSDDKLGTLAGLIEDLEKLHRSDRGECKQCELDNGWDYAGGPRFRDWPCPTMEIVQRHKRNLDREAGKQMKFVEGAAYVGPSRNTVYISSNNGDLWEWEREHRVNGTVVRVDPPSRPDDLVLIWEPGDPMPEALEAARIKGADHSVLADVRWELDSMRQEISSIEFNLINEIVDIVIKRLGELRS